MLRILFSGGQRLIPEPSNSTQEVRVAPTDEQELQQAIEQWLHARDHFHGGNGIGGLDEFWESHRRLVAAFTAGWRGDQELSSDAYDNFLRALVQDHERPKVAWRQSDLLT